MLKRQKGQGLVEFALILPVLLLIILAIIETALIFQGYLTVQHAAREAARWAVTGQPERGMRRDGNPCGGAECSSNESETDHMARRVGLIKQVAIEKAAGLRIDPDAGINDPNYYGVEVWGFPSFSDPVQGDHPSLPGLPIKVRVVHNVELLDPIFRAIVPRVRVEASTEMINEGTQAGFGNMAPPSIGALPPLPTSDWGPQITDTPVGGGVTLTPLGTPTSTSTATPTPTSTPTNTPTATPTGPFITASDYLVTPTQVILIDVNQHPPDVYELRWLDENESLVTVISPTLDVDASEFRRDIVFTIPGNNQGTYYLETRLGGGRIALSAAIEVLHAPPDLIVSSISVPLEIMPNQEITVSVSVRNLSSGPVSGYFDVDLYVDPAYEPIPSQPGDSKLWLLGIGSYETQVVTHVVTLYGGGPHELWAQVDTSNWVTDESDETNNINGPLGVTAVSGECSDLVDRFSRPPLDSKWLSALLGNASVHNMTVEADGTLSIETNGTSIWSSSDAGGTFLHQAFTGDFIATLKINQGLDTASYAKFGLMARGNTQNNSPLVMVMHTRDSGIQFGYRSGPGQNMDNFGNNTGDSTVPIWVRLMRIDDRFTAYYSYDGSSWSLGGSVTVDFPNTLLIGIAGASYSSGSSTGNVDDFEVCPIDAEATSCQANSDDFEGEGSVEWSDVDVGSTAPGSSSRSGGVMTVSGNGGSLWGSDNFHYTYQQVSGNFVATLKINSGPTLSGWAKAGLMVRGSTDTLGARVMVMKSRDAGVQFGVRRYDGGPAERFGSDTGSGALPVWARIVRIGDDFSAYYSTDGSSWTYAGSTTVDLPEDVMIGMGVSSYSSGNLDSGEFDDFLFCSTEGGGIEAPLPPPLEKPPGLKECVQTIEIGDFEASVIYPVPWMYNADTRHAFAHSHSGNFSLNFRASRGPLPARKHLNPWAYQTVSVPDGLLPQTTGTLSFWQYIEPDPEDDPRDPDDYFYLAVQDSDGVTETEGILLAQGTTDTPEFQQNVISVETHLAGGSLVHLAGQDIRLKFYGVHDGQDSGTHFYIDDVRFDICTIQTIPADIPDTASIGGLVEVLLAGTPTKMPGVQMWAFAPGGELYRTQSIHNSTYHFYNIPPGIYTIYAEVWVGGHLYTVMSEVEVGANERNYSVHLLLE